MYLCLVVMHSVLKKRYLISKSNDNRRERALENLFVTKPDPLDTNIQRNVWKRSCRKTYKVWFCESDVFQWRRKQPTFLVGDLTNNLLKGFKKKYIYIYYQSTNERMSGAKECCSCMLTCTQPHWGGFLNVRPQGLISNGFNVHNVSNVWSGSWINTCFFF